MSVGAVGKGQQLQCLQQDGVKHLIPPDAVKNIPGIKLDYEMTVF